VPVVLLPFTEGAAAEPRGVAPLWPGEFEPAWPAPGVSVMLRRAPYPRVAARTDGGDVSDGGRLECTGVLRLEMFLIGLQS
jgi:hypothetical protein